MNEICTFMIEELNKNVIETQMNNVTLYEQSLQLRQKNYGNFRKYSLHIN